MCSEKKEKKSARNLKYAQSKNMSRDKMCFTSALRKVKKSISRNKPKTVEDAIKIAIKSAKTIKGKMKPASRVVKIPKTGGILPLIPIFAGLSALGALGGGVGSIARAISRAKEAKKQLNESQRHNKTMEAIAMGKGLYLKPYKQGLGLYINNGKTGR